MKSKIAYPLFVMLFTACMISCSEDDFSSKDSVKHTMTMHLNASRKGYDGISTRAASQWEEGDSLYLLFTTATGRTSGVAYYHADSKDWQVNYYGSLNSGVESQVKVYYFEHPAEASTVNATLAPTTAIYYDATGTYLLTDKHLEVTTTLQPILGRIRFKGEPGTKFSLQGLSTARSYSCYNAEITYSSDQVNAILIHEDGYSSYIYGSFVDVNNPQMIVTHDAIYTAQCDTYILKEGKSGWMNLPTWESHNGWYATVYPVTSIELNPTTTTIIVGDTLRIQATVLPANATNKKIQWTTSDPTVVEVCDGFFVAKKLGNATLTATSLLNTDIKATCQVYVVEHMYVDLGLSVKWATCNVGARKPEQYGDYFAWGETTPQAGNTYSWTSYKYANGAYNKITKYCNDSIYGFKDDKTELDAEDDAATANWGTDWCMPTDAQWTELRTKCTWTWTSVNGVNGIKVTATNRNSIFLPAASFRANGKLYTVGSEGCYWSRSIDTSDPSSAWRVGITSTSGFVYRSSYSRCCGFSVRPIRSK